jgi:phosphoribosyl-AMP cyclohydrolase
MVNAKPTLFGMILGCSVLVILRWMANDARSTENRVGGGISGGVQGLKEVVDAKPSEVKVQENIAKPAAAAPQKTCDETTFEQNTSYKNGQGLGNAKAESAKACCHMCAEYAGCAHFTFHNGECWYKDEAGGRITMKGATSGAVGLNVGMPKTCDPSKFLQQIVYKNGQGLSHEKADSAEACCQQCDKIKNCRYWTYAGGVCWHKDNNNGKMGGNGVSGGV